MIDQQAFRSAMARLGASVTLVTTDGPAGRYGMAASAVCSVTDAPPTILVCINRSSSGHEAILKNGVVCVNVIAGRHQDLCSRFATPGLSMDERFSDADAWSVKETGSPVLKDASASLDCRIAQTSEVGSHTVLFCEVQDIVMAEESECLIYFDRTYCPLPAATA